MRACVQLTHGSKASRVGWSLDGCHNGVGRSQVLSRVQPLLPPCSATSAAAPEGQADLLPNGTPRQMLGAPGCKARMRNRAAQSNSPVVFFQRANQAIHAYGAGFTHVRCLEPIARASCPGAGSPRQMMSRRSTVLPEASPMAPVAPVSPAPLSYPSKWPRRGYDHACVHLTGWQWCQPPGAGTARFIPHWAGPDAP